MKHIWIAAGVIAVAAGTAGVVHRDWLQDTLLGPEARVSLNERPCRFAPESGRALTCFDLRVPQTRGVRGGRMISLPVLIFRAPDPDRKSDPVVVIGGGPGAVSYTEPRFSELWRDKFKELPWLKGRDLIVYDQRGVGGARPSLECPEVDATRSNPLDTELLRSTMVTCRDRLLREGVDLAAYDTQNSADDLQSLRRALRLPEWNIWAQSYGTRIALTLLRRSEHGVRSAILDGVYPPEVAGQFNAAVPFRRTLDLIFSACARDAACNTEYPELEAKFTRLLERLRRSPISVASDPAPQLPAAMFRINDILLLTIVENMFYTAEGIGRFPWLIERLTEGKNGALAADLEDWDLVAFGPFVTTGAAYLIECNDVPESDDSDERALAQKDPRLRRWIEHTMAIKPCSVWSAGRPPTLKRETVASAVPALIIAGRFDLATPPEWARIAARPLSRAQIVLVRGGSHDASDHVCAQSAIEAFLERPESDLSLFCGQADAAPEFKRKADEE
jgi:pimeloyl-ACP methyl ester carboxylesterase